jgi:hypothetical protein
MEITGTIIQILPEVGGTGKTGNAWRKQEYILETKDQYPKKICFNAWGDKIDQFALQQGDEATVSFDVESREYNGRWFTEVKAWNVRKGAAAPAASGGTSSEPPVYAGLPPSALPEDDLPF